MNEHHRLLYMKGCHQWKTTDTLLPRLKNTNYNYQPYRESPRQEKEQRRATRLDLSLAKDLSKANGQREPGRNVWNEGTLSAFGKQSSMVSVTWDYRYVLFLDSTVTTGINGKLVPAALAATCSALGRIPSLVGGNVPTRWEMYRNLQWGSRKMKEKCGRNWKKKRKGSCTVHVSAEWIWWENPVVVFCLFNDRCEFLQECSHAFISKRKEKKYSERDCSQVLCHACQPLTALRLEKKLAVSVLKRLFNTSTLVILEARNERDKRSTILLLL